MVVADENGVLYSLIWLLKWVGFRIAALVLRGTNWSENAYSQDQRVSVHVDLRPGV